MYNASEDFHTAVKNGNHQMPLLIFSDTVFTADDIDVTAGIEFDDIFNAEEDIAIGQTLKNNIRFSLFNDMQLLNDYTFGEFIATIGVQIASEAFSQESKVYAEHGDTVCRGYDYEPYLVINGEEPETQPDGAVRNILIYDGYIYVFTATGYKVYSEETGEAVARTVSPFMAYKGEHFKRSFGAVYDNSTRMMEIYRPDVHETYEFVPLGVFIADRPDAPMVHTINMVCDDRMKKFDVNMPSNETLGITFPTTIATLYTKICDYMGVPYKTTSFINADGVISKRPKEFDSSTVRQVLSWIAEAAGSNAKFDRDGVLCLEWLKTTSVSLDENDYRTFDPCWYETQTVDKLYNRLQGNNDRTYGSGSVGYLILDNPLLKGVS